MEQPAQKTTVDKVRNATLAALLCADSYGVKVLAIPGMGTGVGGVSMGSAADDSWSKPWRNYETGQQCVKIILIDRDPTMVQAFRDALLAERA